MTVNLKPPGTLHPVGGIRLATAQAGIRTPDRADVALIECAPGSSVAAVFTRNAFSAAPVLVAKEHLAQASPRFLLINSGNANAGTGAQGLLDARSSCRRVAGFTKVAPEQVLPFSTGVIGEPLPLDRLEAGIEDAVSGLARDHWLKAARAIMTTDTVPKAGSVQFEVGGEMVTLTGIAKGAGMICPDMATMLAFLATDAVVDAGLLQQLLEEAVDASFNRISVDGDTSTNDACVLIASGAAPVARIDTLESEGCAALRDALHELCLTLAQAIVRDAEGASRFVTVEVGGASTKAEALAVCYTVAHSPLVKTALFAGDPNWGRILAAVGRSGVEGLDPNRIGLWINDVLVARHGAVSADYAESDGQAAMQCPEVLLRIDLGMGDESETIWTSDLSHEYVRINAEYRT